jgi:hypothetical protein
LIEAILKQDDDDKREPYGANLDDLDETQRRTWIKRMVVAITWANEACDGFLYEDMKDGAVPFALKGIRDIWGNLSESKRTDLMNR